LEKSVSDLNLDIKDLPSKKKAFDRGISDCEWQMAEYMIAKYEF